LRQRRQQGTWVVALELYRKDVDQLEMLGWLAAADRGKEAITDAFIDFVNAALTMGISRSRVL